MEPGMPILVPAPMDAKPGSLPPYCIGTHKDLVPLQSGNPQKLTPQLLDVALFNITKPDWVTSMQGKGYFDTPATVSPLQGGMRVKKVGRTTGLRLGTVIGQFPHLIPLPYQSSQFSATVFFQGVWGVTGDGDDPFSSAGDSGSLVVTEDGTTAVGLVFGGMNDTLSLILPFDRVIQDLGVTLVSGWNIS
jgi:hypothetical protein